MTNMHIACVAAGGQAQLARDLGVTAGAVNHWVTGARPVPIQHCVAIERLSKGAVTRRDLRPDDWHLIWPELAESEPNTPVAPTHQAPAAINPEAQGAAHA